MENEKRIERTVVDKNTETKLTIEVTEENISMEGVANVNDLLNVIRLCAESILEEIREVAVLGAIKGMFKTIEGERIMDKLNIEQLLEEALKIIKERKEEEASQENTKEEPTKVVVTIDVENTLVEGCGNRATLLSGVHALCKVLKEEYKMDLHEVFMAIEFAEKFEGIRKIFK